MSKNKNQKFVYIEDTYAEEHETQIPQSLQKEKKIEFSDLLENFDITKLPEKNQAILKKTIKNFAKEKDKEKVEIKFDNSDSKGIERSQNYDSLVKEITKYQTRVKLNREADVLDFSKNIQNIGTSAKSLANNTKELNDFEKDIKNILVNNKYDTDDKILKRENEELLKVNPEELKKRYEEIKKIRHLLFQKEHDNKRKAKIKSKLYHKIKKKQREREERMLIEKLGEVDPEAVNSYLEKKNMDRIKERIELKHSFNSKFSKTVKRYNLQSDLNVKEAIKENLKLRDELMKKIKGKDNSASENSLSDDQEVENDDENLSVMEQNEEDVDIGDEVDKVDKENLLIDFDEDENNIKKNAKKDPNNSGVWGMKFMENKDNELKNRLKNVLEEVDSESFDLDEDEIEYRDRKFKNNKKETKINKEKDLLNIKKSEIREENQGKITSRRKNVLDIENESNQNISKKPNKSKITNEILQELNDDAEGVMKEVKKPGFTTEELKKIVEIEEIKQDDELFNKFLISNETNKKEFLEKPKEKKEDNSRFLSGWNTWAGDSKEIHAKEFLRKKRFQQIQNRKMVNNIDNNNPNPHVKLNNHFDKKFSNYLVQELPRNVRNESEFEKLNQIPLGLETNSLTMYKKLIQPNILKKIGQIIEPMKINDNTNAKKLCDIIEKATKKIHRTKANM